MPRRPFAPDSASALAAALFMAFAVWSVASIAWAGSSHDATRGAAAALLDAAAFAVGSLTPARLAARASVAGAATLAVIGLVVLQRISDGAAVRSTFVYDRLAAPTGYPNASAALFVLPVWALLSIAAARAAPAWRIASLALAGALVELALLPQSRGMLYAAIVVTVLWIAVARERARAALAAAVVVVAVLVMHGPILGLFPASREPLQLRSDAAAARDAILISTLALGLVALVWAVADARSLVPRRAARALSVAAAAAATAAAVAGVAFAWHRYDGPAGALDRAWRSWNGGEPQGGQRFTGLGSDRATLWRRSLAVSVTHPVQGVGAGNALRANARGGDADPPSASPHSAPLTILEETGIVGALMFVAAIAAAARVVARRQADTLSLGLAACFAYWLLHASVERLWSFRAVTATAFLLLGLAAARATGVGARHSGQIDAPTRRGLP